MLALPLLSLRGTSLNGATLGIGTVSITATDPWRLRDGPLDNAAPCPKPPAERPPAGVALCAREKGGTSDGERPKPPWRAPVGWSKECVVWCDGDIDEIDGGLDVSNSGSMGDEAGGGDDGAGAGTDTDIGGTAVDCEPVRAREVGGKWKLTGDATATLRTRRMVEDEEPEAMESFRAPPAVGKGANGGDGERTGEASPVGCCKRGLGGIEMSGKPRLLRTSR